MTRPPVGSTGTLAELQVGPGDVVESEVDDHWQPIHSGQYTLISRANPDQPAHIITHEGRTFDLTALETPFGLLPEPVQEALKAWPHGFEMMTYSGQMIEYSFPDMKGNRGAVWRAKPAPAETRVQCYRGEYYKAKEHGTCIKRPDGSIDWQSWREANT